MVLILFIVGCCILIFAIYKNEKTLIMRRKELTLKEQAEEQKILNKLRGQRYSIRRKQLKAYATLINFETEFDKVSWMECYPADWRKRKSEAQCELNLLNLAYTELANEAEAISIKIYRIVSNRVINA
jgi:hypothetical protein